MPCYHPITAWRTSTGVYFRPTIDATDIKLPCGRCIGCRLERSRQWAVRMMHELRDHESASFITLTYDEEHLPKDRSLNVKHFQDFMKRLRKWKSLKDGGKIRFFHAGEYGEQTFRPHYHAIIYGEDFRFDGYAKLEKETGTTWMSKTLDSLWGMGRANAGNVTFESCAYVARYICKKVTGKAASKHYERYNPDSGEIFDLRPEYCTMSRRPGIGSRHFEKYHRDIYRGDYCVVRGHRSKPPKFYDRQLEKIDPELYALIKDDRECALSLADKAERSPARLEVRESVKLAQITSLRRDL